MNSRSGGSVEKLVSAALSKSSSKGKNVSEVPGPVADQLTNGVAEMNVDDGWEVPKKLRNRSGSKARKPSVPQNLNPKAWGHPDSVQKLGLRNNGGSGKGSATAWAAPAVDSRTAGRGNARYQLSNRGFENSGQPPLITPPLEHGWCGRSDLIQSFEDGPPKGENTLDSSPFNPNDDKDDDDDDDDHIDDSDDEYDSDESQKSHETRKNSKWFKSFFEFFDNLTVEQINEPERQWHCEACQGGPGAIEWYRGLQALINHAKTKKSKRVKLHRELAELLDEELRRRGTSVIPAGEAFGKWEGLDEKVVRDKEIVWPPMVIIMNTLLDKDENGKWLGMGNEELLEYFKSYDAMRARHSYGPQGHRGMSVLIFEASAVGFLEAERLSKHFEDQGTDREGWDRRRVPFLPGGKRQLYGYMADKGDLDLFNQHCQGKSKLKFEMRSYKEMVVSQMKQMNEDNQQLIWYKNKFVKEQKRSKTLEESLGVVSEKLRKTSEESCIVRQRSKMHHEQNKEEMDYQEEFFKNQIKLIHKAQEEKEDNFEKIQQEERGKVKQYLENPSSSEDQQSRLEKAENFIKLQDEEMDEFAEERDKLQKEKEEKKAEMKKRHGQEEVALEKEYDAKLTWLMEKYTPNQSNEGK